MDTMARHKKQKVIVIVGPTSSGKSDLAVELARKLGGEVISADSRQVYRGLDIGTGKITKREMKSVPHHLLDVSSPKRTFTAHDFRAKAQNAIDDIAKRGKLPIVAGGTGFYLDALVGNAILPDAPTNRTLRARLEKKEVRELFEMLEKKDPRRAKRIDPFNKRRIIRALEIAEHLGQVPLQKKGISRYDILWIGITLERAKINERINKRLLDRMKRGMAAEARLLHKQGLSYKRMEGLGLEYRWLARFLRGDVTKSGMLENLERDIRHYAKRQMTYWRRNKKINWFAPKEKVQIVKAARKWLTTHQSA